MNTAQEKTSGPAHHIWLLSMGLD